MAHTCTFRWIIKGSATVEKFHKIFFSHFFLFPCFLSPECHLHINIELNQPKDMIVEGLHQCFCFSFSCFSLLFSEWSLSTTSRGLLAMKAQEASSQCSGGSECYCLCLFVFLFWVCFKNPIKRSSICLVYMSFLKLRGSPECLSPIFKLYTLPAHLLMWFIHSHPLMWFYKCISASCW